MLDAEIEVHGGSHLANVVQPRHVGGKSVARLAQKVVERAVVHGWILLVWGIGVEVIAKIVLIADFVKNPEAATDGRLAFPERIVSEAETRRGKKPGITAQAVRIVLVVFQDRHAIVVAAHARRKRTDECRLQDLAGNWIDA